MSAPRAISSLAVVLAPVLVACASSGGPGMSAETTAPAECGRSASYEPGELGFGEVFDSAGAAGALRSIWDPDQGLVLATFGAPLSAGEGPVWVGAEGGDSAHATAIRAVLESARRAGADQEDPLMIVVGDESGARPRAVANVSICAPVPVNRDHIRRRLANLPPAIRDRAGGDGLQAQVMVHVTRDGSVSEARIRVPSGDSDFDRAAIQIAREIRFSPMITEGIPRPVWTSIPIQLRTRSIAGGTP